MNKIYSYSQNKLIKRPLLCPVTSLLHVKQYTLSSFVSIYYASLMKRVETNDNQVLSIMVKSCCFTELSMKLDSCNLLLIPQNTVTPHSSEKRESIVSVWGLVQGNVCVQISLCLTRNYRCFYITNCHVAGGQIKPSDGTVDRPPACTDTVSFGR